MPPVSSISTRQPTGSPLVVWVWIHAMIAWRSTPTPASLAAGISVSTWPRTSTCGRANVAIGNTTCRGSAAASWVSRLPLMRQAEATPVIV
jgi:hypothetical protein